MVPAFARKLLLACLPAGAVPSFTVLRLIVSCRQGCRGRLEQIAPARAQVWLDTRRTKAAAVGRASPLSRLSPELLLPISQPQ